MDRISQESVDTTNQKVLWLWRNGEHEFWAFKDIYPRFEGGDSQVIGEPFGYVIIKDNQINFDKMLIAWDNYQNDMRPETRNDFLKAFKEYRDELQTNPPSR